jgi:hydrogenase nickel incorporation protein HypA/HybF
MHELSLCMDVIDQITALAGEHKAHAVSSVTVRIGVLSGVEPQLLEQAFAIAQAGTVADQAQFITEPIAAHVHCSACGADSEAEPGDLRCRQCGSTDTRLTSGDELTLASVELVVPDDFPAAPAAPGTSIH